MELKQLNPLPSPTWNWLRMNESTVEADLVPGAEGDLSQRDTSGVTLVRHPREDGGWAAISGGLGRAFEQALLPLAPTALLESEAGRSYDQPVLLRCTLDRGGSHRILIHAKENSRLSVIVLLQGSGVAALQVKVRAEENASLHLSLVQELDDQGVCLWDVGSSCGKNAAFQLVKLELGGKAVFAGAETDLADTGSRFRASIGYRVRRGQRLDMNYTVRHHGRKTLSQMDADGVLEDGAEKLFRGTIDFPRGCKGAKGSEQESILLLGDQQINQTIPLILCQEEDVEGNHGASIGRLDPQVLFYLASRGISRAAAEAMIARSKLDAVCALIPSPDVRREIAARLDANQEGAADDEL